MDNEGAQEGSSTIRIPVVPSDAYLYSLISSLNRYPPIPSLCYKLPAVNFAANPESADDSSRPAKAFESLEPSSQAVQLPALRNEDPSRYCPVCSQRLESRRCKLICSVCGYYMSCADYY